MRKFLSAAVLFFSLSPIIFPQSSFSVQVHAGPLFITQGEVSTGYSASGGLLYHISEKFDLSVRVGYLNWKTENFGHTVKENSKYYSIPFLAGARYYFSGAKISPYAIVEGGKTFVSSQRSVRFNSTGENVIRLTGSSSSSEGYIFGIGAGLKYIMNDYLNLDFRGMLQHPEVVSEYIELSAGLGVAL